MLELLKHGADAKSRDRELWTPLHLASRMGCVEAAQILLQHGADVNAMANWGWTPLLLACRSGSVSMVKLLLDSGADVTMEESCAGRNPIELARDLGQTDIKNLLRRHEKGSVDEF